MEESDGENYDYEQGSKFLLKTRISELNNKEKSPILTLFKYSLKSSKLGFNCHPPVSYFLLFQIVSGLKHSWHPPFVDKHIFFGILFSLTYYPGRGTLILSSSNPSTYILGSFLCLSFHLMIIYLFLDH